MKKWPIFLAGTAIAIVGCGGGGGTPRPSVVVTTGATSGDSIATVNLPTTVGLLNVYYITGQGRAAGDLTANLASAVLKGPGAPTAQGLFDPLPRVINVQLNQYSLNQQTMDQPGITNSAFYNEFDLNVASLQVQNADGSLGPPITGPNGTFFINPTNGGEQVVIGSGGAFQASVGVFPGRQTSIEVFLNDASINFDPTGSFYQFYRNIFLSNNTQVGNTNIQGFLSDYVMFDITNVASRPHVFDATGANTGFATRVYMGGEDSRYLASGPTYGGPITLYGPNTTNGYFAGTFKGPDTLPNPPTGLPAITQGGTYTLRDPDPRDITGGSQVTSLQGIWRPYTSVMNNLGTFEVIMMPHTGDDNNQDMVVLVRDANGNITNMYYGLADLNALTFHVDPIANIETGSDANFIEGTLSGLVDVNNASTTLPANVRFGRYAFTGALPAGFKSTGRFLVFRD
ncbi:MAG: hypothetical protein ACYC96_13515 [Fimbriimonadaceae bacterium]